jgi:tRNA G26 N,N-dimethylase Trm1
MEANLETPVEVLVFETNIRRKRELRQLARLLGAEKRIEQWNVDLEDCSRVLRVEARCLTPAEVIALLGQAGYACQELPD